MRKRLIRLVAPYWCYHETISAIPPYCALWAFLVSQRGQLGAIPLSVPPWRAREVEVRYPPPLKGYLSDTCAIPYMKISQNGCDTLLCDTISKRYCAIWGGISHWAAIRAHKHEHFFRVTAWVGGSPDRVARGQTFTCCVRSPRNINIFVWDRENVHVPNVYVPFPAPRKHSARENKLRSSEEFFSEELREIVAIDCVK